MKLANYNKIVMYDVRSVINIHRMKDPDMTHKLKKFTNSRTIELVREYDYNKWDRSFQHVKYQGILCFDRENFSGGLYSFKNDQIITLDISQGILVMFDPTVVSLRKHNIDENPDTFRDVVLLYE